MTLCQIAKLFSVPEKAVMDSLTKVTEDWSKMKWYKEFLEKSCLGVDILRRCVFESDCIPNKYKYKVLDYAQQIYKQVSPRLSTKNRTMYCTCIYIATKVLGVKVSQKDVCEMFMVSLATLAKTECTIKRILMLPVKS
ncbi:MAG: hypothetical protein EB119_11005 [Synechococcaceae bacterium WBB_34_004]|nr:hypothetical protein [Synechococcaceae bacterium WBB_34_004]